MKPVCRQCQTTYRPHKNGAPTIEMAFDPPQPYKIWGSDIWKCPGCGHEIVAGFADRALAEHYEDDFAEVLKRVESDKWVTYSYEKPMVEAR